MGESFSSLRVLVAVMTSSSILWFVYTESASEPSARQVPEGSAQRMERMEKVCRKRFICFLVMWPYAKDSQ